MSSIPQQGNIRGLDDMRRVARPLLKCNQVEDNPGSEQVTLTRTFGDET